MAFVFQSFRPLRSIKKRSSPEFRRAACAAAAVGDGETVKRMAAQLGDFAQKPKKKRKTIFFGVPYGRAR